MSLVTRQGKGSKLTIQEMDGNLEYLEQLAQEGGNGLEGTNYLFVSANGTDVENGDQLKAAYDEAKTKSPSANNRITIIAAPGNYDFGGSFTMDTEFIDLVSLDGNRSIINTTPNFEFYRFADEPDQNWTYVGNGEVPFDPNTVSSREYTNFQESLFNEIDENTLKGYLILHSLETDNYYLINFLSWTRENSGGGFSYTRQLITPEMDEPIITFTRTDNGSEVDIIEEGILEIARGNQQESIYNAALEGSADNNISPQGTEWSLGSNFLELSNSHNIDDGGNDMYDGANILSADDYLIFYTHTQLDDDTSNGTPIEDFISDGAVASGEDASMFGPSASYFTNLYPGLFVMCAKNTQIDQFKIDGDIGADGGSSSFADGYNFQLGNYKVFVKRVWGAGSDPSINQIIIVNTTSNNIVQTIDESRRYDLHSLDGLISAGVTEINYLLVAAKQGSELPRSIIQQIATQFISILTSSGNINQLLSNLNANYLDIIDTTISYQSPIKINADNVYLKGVDNGSRVISIGNNLPNVKIENCKGGRNCFNIDVSYKYEIQEEINDLNIESISAFHNGTVIYDESTIAEENALDFKDALGGAIGANVLYTPLIMRDIVNNDYYIVKFYSWTPGGNGGGFSYTRQLITEEGDAPIISFTKTNYGSEVDVISEGVLEITRGENGPIFNIALEESSNGVNPDGTEWFITGGYEYTTEQQEDIDDIQSQIDELSNELSIPVELRGEFINCEGDRESFGFITDDDYNELGLNLVVSGTFIDCKSEFNSFAHNGTASGTFTNCISNGSAFGYYGQASGTFIDCVSGGQSFGTYGQASGTFTNCVGNSQSFAYSGEASGTFTNCISSDSSFGTNGQASGTFTDCEASGQSFGSFGQASGTFTNCVGGGSSFGLSGEASGTFINCVGESFSFGSLGKASGTFTNCTGETFSFGTGDTASGTFTNCIGGSQSFGSSFFGNVGTASGTFTNCVAGGQSFSEFGGLVGKLYYCRLTSGTFPTVTGGAKLVLCVDGQDDIINEG
jgi:hypothetical protein